VQLEGLGKFKNLLQILRLAVSNRPEKWIPHCLSAQGWKWIQFLKCHLLEYGISHRGQNVSNPKWIDHIQRMEATKYIKEFKWNPKRRRKKVDMLCLVVGPVKRPNL
jgi:hypothetical protein